MYEIFSTDGKSWPLQHWWDDLRIPRVSSSIVTTATNPVNSTELNIFKLFNILLDVRIPYEYPNMGNTRERKTLYFAAREQPKRCLRRRLRIFVALAAMCTCAQWLFQFNLELIYMPRCLTDELQCNEQSYNQNREATA